MRMRNALTLAATVLSASACSSGGDGRDLSNPAVQLPATRDVEEGAGTVEVEISLQFEADEDVRIPFEIEGDGADFEIAEEAVTILAGETSGILSIAIVQDDLHEAEEALVINLLEPEGPARLEDDTSTTIRILDDDEEPELEVAQANLSGTEGAGSVVITFELDRISGLDVTLSPVLEGSATEGEDYALASSSVRIAAGETRAALEIELLDDDETEGSETITVTASEVSGATVGAAGSAHVTLLDDESPASADVVFIASLTTGARALLSVNEGDAEPTVLVEPLIAGSEVDQFVVSPDGSQVALVGDLETNNVFELFVVPVDGSEPHRKLSAPMTGGGDVFLVHPVQWSPDGQFVAYIADQIQKDKLELFVVRADGSAPPINVSNSLIGGSDLRLFDWSPTANRIVFQSDRLDNGMFELFAVDADGSNDVRLNPDLFASMGNIEKHYQWAPDGSRIAYFARQDSNRHELYTVLPDGSDNVRISGTILATTDVLDFQWSPDSTRIAFRADRTVNGRFDLWSAAPTSVDIIELSALPESAARDVDTYEWSPDSTRMAYRADEAAADQVFELYTVARDGSERARVSGSLVTGGNVVEFQWSPGSDALAYMADQIQNNVFELFVGQPDGSGFVKVSGPMTGTGLDPEKGRDAFLWLPDGSRVAYGALQESPIATEVYSSNPDGTDNQELSGPMLTAEPNLVQLRLLRSGRLAYATTQETIGLTEIYATDTDNDDDVAKLSGSDLANGGVDPDAFVTP